MTAALEKLNQAPDDIAERHFLDCCGSRQWARMMAEARPFANVVEVINEAEKIWQNLKNEDWLEAFAAHPQIGARKAVSHQSAQAADWSQSEQSDTKTAAAPILQALAEANRLYEVKFGFIFIVCATGKTAEEMLEICRERLKNAARQEIGIAAQEQRKITEIRLRKFLEV